jgi:DNA-binding MarR family transcriptional regulator
MEAVLEVADKPTELLYHLGKNPDIAEDLSGLSPYKLAQKLTRIEAELKESGSKKTSSAPKPLQEVRGSASNSRALADLEDKDFVKRRREQIASRR